MKTKEEKALLRSVERMVGEFNEIPTEMFKIAVNADYEAWEEVTIFDEEEMNCLEVFPMWGTMWSFGCSLDDDWLEYEGGLEIMSKIGFRIYKHEEFGYFFGVDSTGDFYRNYWTPLYLARGWTWHLQEAC